MHRMHRCTKEAFFTRFPDCSPQQLHDKHDFYCYPHFTDKETIIYEDYQFSQLVNARFRTYIRIMHLQTPVLHSWLEPAHPDLEELIIHLFTNSTFGDIMLVA